jgi:hypothetical protein
VHVQYIPRACEGALGYVRACGCVRVRRGERRGVEAQGDVGWRGGRCVGVFTVVACPYPRTTRALCAQGIMIMHRDTALSAGVAVPVRVRGRREGGCEREGGREGEREREREGERRKREGGRRHVRARMCTCARGRLSARCVGARPYAVQEREGRGGTQRRATRERAAASGGIGRCAARRVYDEGACAVSRAHLRAGAYFRGRSRS